MDTRKGRLIRAIHRTAGELTARELVLAINMLIVLSIIVLLLGSKGAGAG